MVFNFAQNHSARRLLVPLVIAATAALWPGVAGAGDTEALERRAADLVDRLEKELEAVRREREALERERKAMEAQRKAVPVAPSGTSSSSTAQVGAAEQDRKIDILSREVQQLKENVAVPATKELKSQYGMGPAASKVYSVARGLSIGGYGESLLNLRVDDEKGAAHRADALRFVLYTGYKFSDRIILNTELEFEHATTEETKSSGSGEVALEFAYLDFLGWDWLNARLGLVLVPMGFINEIHEPVFFHGANRPEVERRIIPSTWNALGAGIHGALPGGLQYRGYLSTSLNAMGFETEGIREARQAGNRELAEDLAGSFRLDYSPTWAPGLLVGGSAFVGETGQKQLFDGERRSALLSLWDLHAQYRWRGLEFRALAAFGNLSDAGAVSRQLDETIADRFEGHYVEAAYDIMPWMLPDLATQYLAPFVRYEHVDPQTSVAAGFERVRSETRRIIQAGLTYKPHPQVVLKLDYRNIDAASGVATDDVNAGLGFVF